MSGSKAGQTINCANKIMRLENTLKTLYHREQILLSPRSQKTQQNKKKGWENVHSSVWDAAVSMATYLATAATFLLSECPPASRVFGSQSIRARADCETRPGTTPKIGARRGKKKKADRVKQRCKRSRQKQMF